MGAACGRIRGTPGGGRSPFGLRNRLVQTWRQRTSSIKAAAFARVVVDFAGTTGSHHSGIGPMYSNELSGSGSSQGVQVIELASDASAAEYVSRIRHGLCSRSQGFQPTRIWRAAIGISWSSSKVWVTQQPRRRLHG